LNIYQSFIDNQPEIKQWSLQGNQGDSWFRATIPIASKNQFFLMVEGVAGPSYFGFALIEFFLIIKAY
jgi:hypothetical protein